MNIGLSILNKYENDQGSFLPVYEIDEAQNLNEQRINLNGATVVVRRWNREIEYKAEYQNTNPCFGLHFLLEGSCKFLDNEKKLCATVKSGRYNLTFWPPFSGVQKITGKSYISVDVFYTKLFLESLLGNKYAATAAALVPPTANQVKSLSKGGLPIPGNLKIILDNILNCSFPDEAGINYLKSQTQSLLVETFLGVNNVCSSANSGLPDYECLAIERVVGYIKKNLRANLTIKELSEIAGFNTTKLKNCFKSKYGTTIFKYITQHRMEKAKILIIKNNYTIAQASYEVGYSNPQHLTVAFKKTMGYLPSSMLEKPL